MKQKISSEFLQKIKDSVNIIEVIGEHVVLRKSGANYVGLCPFHSERSPSFSVNESKQLYHCYGCKRGGDLLTFVKELHGLSFVEAVEELAERARIQMPKDWARDEMSKDLSPEELKRREQAREKMVTALRLNRFTASFYHQQLGTLSDAQTYLKSRNIDGEVIRNFYLGATPPGWESLSAFLASKKAPLPLAAELGLVRLSPSNRRSISGGPGYFDLFRNRIIFPLLDMRGKVLGFGGRSFRASSQSDDGPKYLNSSESLVFHKSKYVYGLYQSQKEIRERDEVILVEGYFDVLALHAAGFPNAVATCGTALTPDHLRVLKRLASKIIVLFDGDRAGIEATERAMELGLEAGWVLQGASLPKGKDPDDLTRSPALMEELQALLKNARPLLDVRMEGAILEAAKGPEEKTQAIRKIAHWMQKYTDPVGKEVRLQDLQKKAGISRQLLEKAKSPGKAPTPSRAATKSSKSVHSIHPREKVALTAMIRSDYFGKLLAEVRDRFPPKQTYSDLFESEAVSKWVRQILQQPGYLDTLRKAPEWMLPDAPDNGFLDSELRSIVTESLVSAEPVFSENEVRLALGRCIGRAWARFSQQIKIALADAESKKDAGLQAELMKEYLDVQRKMKEFNSFYDEA